MTWRIRFNVHRPVLSPLDLAPAEQNRLEATQFIRKSLRLRPVLPAPDNDALLLVAQAACQRLAVLPH
jgi:hypothetical protein